VLPQPQAAAYQVPVANHDCKLRKRIPVIQKGVCFRAQRSVKTQELLLRQRDVDLSFAQFSAFRRTSLGDVSGHLRGMPPGTTLDIPMETTKEIPAGKRRNKTLSGVTDTRGFWTWLRESCPSGLSAQMKGERLLLVPKTADDFRATVSALRSLHGSKGVRFHTFPQSEGRCVRLLLKNLAKHSPDRVLWEELETGHSCSGNLAVPLWTPRSGCSLRPPPDTELHSVGCTGSGSQESALLN
jgi:hypothetical protein